MIRPRRWFEAARWCAALIVLASIAIDLVDTQCHAAPEMVSRDTSIASSRRVPGDPCEDSGGVCVPDCFCCCARIEAIGSTLVAEVQPAPVPVAALCSPAPLAGVDPTPYHPPLA